MFFKKSKYGPSLKNNWILGILASLGLIGSQSDKSVEIYETFKDYMTLEQCSEKEAVAFTAKYYRLSKPQLLKILNDFSHD